MTEEFKNLFESVTINLYDTVDIKEMLLDTPKFKKFKSEITKLFTELNLITNYIFGLHEYGFFNDYSIHIENNFLKIEIELEYNQDGIENFISNEEVNIVTKFEKNYNIDTFQLFETFKSDLKKIALKHKHKLNILVNDIKDYNDILDKQFI